MPLGEFLLEQLTAATSGLAQVTERPLFGCRVLFVRGRTFALIWKNRIGLKLPNPAAFAELSAREGSGRWTMTKRTAASSWVLVPEAFHDQLDELTYWASRAHALVGEAPRAKSKSKPARARGRKPG